MPKELKRLLKATMEAVPMNFEVPPESPKLKIDTFVIQFLEANDIPYNLLKGNIYSLRHPTKPLLSAHMDSVGKEWPLVDEATKYYIQHVKNEFISTFNTTGGIFQGSVEDYDKTILKSPYGLNIGADDKAGVALILATLLTNKEINFIFSRQEETSPHSVQEVINANKNAFKQIPYCLVLDRKNDSDIIGLNKYCCKDFIDALEGIDGFDFKDAHGSISDGNQLMEVVPTVNLSTGYYEAHTGKEYIHLEAWLNTYDFVQVVLKTLKKRFELYKPTVYTYNSSYNYSSNYPAKTSKKKKKMGLRGSIYSVYYEANNFKRTAFHEDYLAPDKDRKIISITCEGKTFNKLHVDAMDQDAIYSDDYQYLFDLTDFTYLDLSNYGLRITD